MARTGMGAAEAKWAGRIEQLEESGLSLRKFAEREGIKAGTLSFWKWKLAQRARGRGQAPRVAPLQFVELTAQVPAAPSPAMSLELVLRSGLTVRVPNGFHAAELVRLVDVLEEVRS